MLQHLWRLWLLGGLLRCWCLRSHVRHMQFDIVEQHIVVDGLHSLSDKFVHENEYILSDILSGIV